jgi:hypothetical protein
MWFICKLDPLMSSTFITFQSDSVEAFVSPSHAKVQFWPSVKESPGPGAVGVGSASARREKEAARRAVKVVEENMV